MIYSSFKERYAPITQKGQALKHPMYIMGLKATHHALFTAKEIVNDTGFLEGAYPFGTSHRLFARPCPMRPRHGFVDSRIINTWEELLSVAEETIIADPEGEIAVTEPLEATYNAILTPTSFTIGPGNDGATAGKNSISFGLRPYTLLEGYKKPFYIRDTPFFELVYEPNELPVIVQLRDGPSVPFSIDNVPVETVVKRVVFAEADLLEWEAIISKAEQGTVCYHPEGSLSSHYSIHCIMHGIPVMISRQPFIGETLQPTSGGEEMTKIDWPQLKLGFQTACEDFVLTQESAARIMLTVLHCVKQPSSYLLGIGMGCAFRLTLTASSGEMRHSYNRKLLRDTVYKSAWGNVKGRRLRLAKYAKAFFEASWTRGFGGEPWGVITQHAIDLHNAVINENPKVVAVYNSLVHSQHNNAWAFDKFIHESYFFAAAKGNPKLFIQDKNAGPHLHHLMTNPSINPFKWRAI